MKKGGKKRSGTLKWIAITVSAFLLVVLFFAAIMAMATDGIVSGNTARIKITGVIVSGGSSLFGSETASSEEIVENIKKAEEDGRIKAILLDINSPGGSAVASEEVATAIKNAEKPVVALIRDVGASGAYWAASSADVIVASPMSITGSVGATASYLEFSGLMQKYGVGYERLVSGELKDTGTPVRKLTDDEKGMLQEIIELTAGYFIESVKENRGLTNEIVEEISSGRIYTGQQAISLGLVDKLGNIDTAKEVAAEMAGVESASLVEFKTKKPLSIASIISQQAAIVGRSIGASLLPSEEAISLT